MRTVRAFSIALLAAAALVPGRGATPMAQTSGGSLTPSPHRWRCAFYSSRTEQGKQYPILCRRMGSLEASEEILLDLNALAAGLKFMAIGTVVPSDDGNLLAYTTDSTGYRQYVLHVKD